MVVSILINASSTYYISRQIVATIIIKTPEKKGIRILQYMFTQTILNFCISELKEKSWGVDSNRTILQLVSPTLESGKDQLICPYLAPDLCDFFKSWIILNAYYNEKIRWIKHQNLNQSWRKLLTKLVYSCAYLSILVIFCQYAMQWCSNTNYNISKRYHLLVFDILQNGNFHSKC